VLGKRKRAKPALGAMVATASLLTTVGCAASAGHPAVAEAARNPILFGTLGSMPAKASAEHKAGVTGATLELDWKSYEPAPGRFAAAYTADARNRLAAFRAAGQTMTLALGIHEAPDWARALPDAIAVDQHGDQLPGVDMVFSQPVRDAVAAYLTRLQHDLDLRSFAYVRLTSGGNPEMLYNSRGSYAAFSNAAQNGPGLATGMPRNPLPGWRPGTRGISTALIRRWADWYVGALDDVTRWQMRVLDGLGFTGVYQTVTPGSGVRPDQYDRAVGDYLPDGLLGIGGAWARYYVGLAGSKRIMTYVSSVADGSADDNDCAGADRAEAIRSKAAGHWSATRWQSRLADEYGFAKGGENPGLGAGVAVAPHYGDRSDRGMLAVAVRQAASCGFEVFNFAHDDHLWREGPGLTAYATRIKGH
jgi:hypothetical protein